MKRRISIHDAAPIGLWLMPALLVSCLAYYLAFAANLGFYDGASGLFQLALNSHDHFIYVDSIDRVQDGDFGYELSNDVGIAAIYLLLSKLLQFLVDVDFALLALLFNGGVLLGCYLVYSRICGDLGLGLL